MSTQPIVAEGQNELQGLIDSFSKLAPLFGSGEQTGTSVTTPDAGASANANSLLAQLQGGVDPKYLDDLQNQIFDQARQKIAPELLNSVGAGNRAYSDTTLKDFASRATGYATAASAQAKLEAINKNNSLMTQIVDAQIKASSTKTTTTKTAASPAGKALQYAGVALGGYSAAKTAYDKATGKKKSGTGIPSSNPFETTGTDVLSSDVGSGGASIGGTTSTTGNVEGGFDAATGESGATLSSQALENTALLSGESAGFEIGSNSGLETTANAGADSVIGDTLSAGGIDSGESVIPDFAEENLLDFSGASSDLGDVAYDTGANLVDNFTSIGTDVGTDLVSDAAVDIGLDVGFPYLAAAKFAGDTLGINEISEPLNLLQEGIGGVVDAIGDGLGDIVGGSSAVCYELVRTGGMPKELADVSSAYIDKLNKSVVRGYHYMCPWLIKQMHAHKWVYKTLQLGAITRAKELQSSNILGKITRAIFEPICWIIGVTIAKNSPLQLNIQKMLVDNALLYDLPKDI